MAVELVVPAVGESITEVQIGDWLVGEGESANKEDALVVIETDKVTVELPSPIAGTVTRVLKKKGEKAAVGEVIGYIEGGKVTSKGTTKSESPASKGESPALEAGSQPSKAESRAFKAGPQPAQAESRAFESEPPASKAESAAFKPGSPASKAQPMAPQAEQRKGAAKKPEVPVAAKSARAPETSEPRVMPAAARELAQRGISAQDVEASGPGGRVLKEDVQRRAEQASVKAGVPPAAPVAPGRAGNREEEVVPMTPLRRRIAERLVLAQNTAALLTTFNEIDMSAAIALRNEHKEEFQKRHGVKLGFMSFFVKASIDALKLVPQVNAEIRGDSIVYRNYYDIGVAVGGGKGLVVPILRNAERMSFAEVEQAIGELAARAQANKLTLDELQGGTFTISNGGIYGSLLSTPIVNPPQSGILGLHAIQDRPVARDGQVVVKPMMYVAVTYDHRLVDGREAVGFLKRIKECVENPARMLLEI